jgi:hypothetical protein
MNMGEKLHVAKNTTYRKNIADNLRDIPLRIDCSG